MPEPLKGTLLDALSREGSSPGHSSMLKEVNPLVRFKLSILRKAMPANSVFVLGDMYVVEGGYAVKCLKYGAKRVLLVDTLETKNWLRTRLRHPQLDFYKGDFSDHLFMSSIRERFEVSVAFDVLLHQPPLLHTLHNILDKTTERFVMVQPMLKEQATPNTLVYLPGCSAEEFLYPMPEENQTFRMFDARYVNHSHWIWGMTPSFIRSVLVGEGFELVHEETWKDLPNSNWHWWGAVARRTADNPAHWSRQAPLPAIQRRGWSRFQQLWT